MARTGTKYVPKDRPRPERHDRAEFAGESKKYRVDSVFHAKKALEAAQEDGKPEAFNEVHAAVTERYPQLTEHLSPMDTEDAGTSA